MRHCMRNNTFCCHYFEIALRKCVALKIWPFILSHSMYSMECLWFSVYYLIKTTKLLRHLRRCRYTHRYCRQKLCLQWQTNTSERRETSLSVASMGLFWFQYESTLNDIIMDCAIHTATFCNFDSTEPINHHTYRVYALKKRSRGCGTSWLDIQIYKLAPCFNWGNLKLFKLLSYK